jgi:SGNH hydrolase-like domain, acetyltransferase AlgX
MNSTNAKSTPNSDAPKSRLLGIIIPALILLFLLLDGLSRLIPLDFFAYRGWEVMSVGRAATGPFAPSKHYFNLWASGDLAAFGCLPKLRQFRREDFTTDAYGYRNATKTLNRGEVDGLLAGDSFAAGCDVSDEDVLSERLMALSQHVIYNAGGVTPEGILLHLPDLLGIANRVKMTHGVVIYEYLERRSPPSIASMQKASFAPQSSPPMGSTFADRLRTEWDDLRVSRLRIVANHIEQSLHSDPPPALDRVVVRHLPDGQEMLFPPDEIAQASQQQIRGVAPDVWIWLQAELKKRNLDLMIVLLPNKYTVYGPLLRERIEPGPPYYLDRLESSLQKAGVPVLNLRPLLQAQAKREWDQGRLIYWKDDSHWNRLGIDFVAKEIVEHWQK